MKNKILVDYRGTGELAELKVMLDLKRYTINDEVERTETNSRGIAVVDKEIKFSDFNVDSKTINLLKRKGIPLLRLKEFRQLLDEEVAGVGSSIN